MVHLTIAMKVMVGIGQAPVSPLSQVLSAGRLTSLAHKEGTLQNGTQVARLALSLRVWLAVLAPCPVSSAQLGTLLAMISLRAPKAAETSGGNTDYWGNIH